MATALTSANCMHMHAYYTRNDSNSIYRPNGILFTVYLVDNDLQDELREGMIVSFQYANITAGGTPIRPIMYL
jgi:hypothetical protein